MSNIFNSKRMLLDFYPTNEDYWDFHLVQDVGHLKYKEGLATDCLSAYIDFNDSECVFWDEAFSKGEHIWPQAKNEDVVLEHIGTTGVDNGLITFQKDRITNKDFLDIFFNSTLVEPSGDMRFHVRKIDGNNQIYNYENNITTIDNIEAARLNGGFYQGYFKLYEKNYQVLPHVLGDGWSLEVRLKKSDLSNSEYTINDVHPANKGFFLYIGTRAENKWWEKYYKTDTEFKPSPIGYNSNGYFETDAVSDDEDENAPYTVENITEYIEDIYGRTHCSSKKDYFIDKKYVTQEYYDNNIDKDESCFGEDYLELEVPITGNEPILSKNGFDFRQANIIRYDTDNKFLLFDRTKDGCTTKNWIEGTIATMYYTDTPNMENLFTLLDRTCHGYTIKTIEDLKSERSKYYNVLKDIYRNGLAFQIKDDGSIGFKYIVKDCESEIETYKIEEMFTGSGVIKDEEWYTISVKITPLSQTGEIFDTCDNTYLSPDGKMIIQIYVNGMLKLKSRELPILNLRALNDLSEKQQGVPFSISIGGGTQGLCDRIGIQYREIPKYMLPLEEYFCGSFVGYVQSFRFYHCPLTINEIMENYKYDCNLLKK